MLNVSHVELAETKSKSIPPNASIEVLKELRESQCSAASNNSFKIQSSQRFLRRALSPDSPARNLLMVHGTGSGKTCSAIQIAEEYIVRPEFQDKRVLILANPSVQENFKTQIFDISRVEVDADGLLLSKQCTGRRYLDMVQRSQSETLTYTDKASQQRLMTIAGKIIGEFYEFIGYLTLYNMIERKHLESKSQNNFNKWIHDTFDNRLIIIDEAHNIKETTEGDTSKYIAIALEKIIGVANGLTLVLLTATPMYDSANEILYYFNLFLWNDRRIPLTKRLTTADIFTENGDFKEGREVEFRSWCQDYVSFIRGENPFTFPFRLPPPDNLVAQPDRKTDINDKPITVQRKFLTLTGSFVSPLQSAAIEKIGIKAVSDSRLICVYPDNKSFGDSFDNVGGSFKYRKDDFLAPSKVALYSSKFARIMNITKDCTGIVFVYSNVVESGAQLFAMCLEEHGYEPFSGKQLLSTTSGEVKRGSKGKYALFTSDISDTEIKRTLVQLKRNENANGSEIRFVIASPKVSEGVDFRNVRQIHVLDPWFNMSRIEQVIGRGMRTCSHSRLPFEEQNCTVYLHVCRYPDSTKETVDEYIYRTFVETKAVRIAKVKRVIMESAIDCDLQQSVNSLPPQWRGESNEAGERFLIPQKRNQDGVEVNLPLSQMSAPTFEDGSYAITCNLKASTADPDHQRPLSAILDVKDEIFDKLTLLFMKKPVWKKADLFEHELMKQYTSEVISYILQNAIDTGFQLKDKHGRVGHLESRKNIFAFEPNERSTLMDRLVVRDNGTSIQIPTYEPSESPVPVAKPAVATLNFLEERKRGVEWPEYITSTFNPDILDWYLVDTFSKEQKIEFLLSINWDSPPIYAAPLLAGTGEDRLFVLGSKEIYNNNKEKITPIGRQADIYNAWITARKNMFVEKKDSLFASIKDGGIIFNVADDTTITRAPRTKVIGGKQCSSYKMDVLNAFSVWLSGREFPEQAKLKTGRCAFLQLLVRKAIVENKEGIFWVTPEEYSIFSEDGHREDLVRRLKA